MAKRRAEKRRWAVTIVRGFVKGFIARNEDANDTNRKFLSFVRYHYLLRLSKNLPTSVLDKKWPDAPGSCKQVPI